MLDLAVEAEIPKLTCWPEIHGQHGQHASSAKTIAHWARVGFSRLDSNSEVWTRLNSGHGGDEIRVFGTRIFDGKRGADFGGTGLDLALYDAFSCRRNEVATLFIKFHVMLEDYKSDSALRHCGPLFHKWLPNGESDALELRTGHPNVHVRVWFERRSFISDGFIRFDYKRREIDETVMRRQGILDAGPLSGLLTLDTVSPAQIAAISAGQEDNDEYIEI